MRTLTLAVVLTLGCNGESETDDVDITPDSDSASDTDTSADDDTSADGDTSADTEADTEPDVACVFRDRTTRALATSPPEQGSSFTHFTQVDACFGNTLQGQYVVETYSPGGRFCTVTMPFTATARVVDEDMCDACDDAFEDIEWGIATVEGSFCDEFQMVPEPPIFCLGNQPVSLAGLATGTEPDALYQNRIPDDYDWRVWISSSDVVRDDDPASGVSVLRTFDDVYMHQGEPGAPCQGQAGAGRQ